MAGGVRVSVAIAADVATLDPDAEFTDLTAADNFVASGQVDRGRQFELDVTETGTASVVINDVEGILDSSNTTGPNFENIRPLLQFKKELYNPVADAYETIFRGFIEEYDYVWDPSQKVNVLTLGCVDAFAILNAIQMQADGTFGDSVPPGALGNIFFARANVDDRMFQVLGNAGWPTAWSTIFSGNVKLLEGIYSPGDTVLQVLQECADAEFPGLANLYVDKFGDVTFHGRKAKFDPVGVSEGAGDAWPFHQWKAGDGAAVAASLSDTAQIRSLSTNYGYDRIINQAYAAPKSIQPADVAGQTFTDSTSQGIYGICSWSADGLLTAGGLDDGLNANDETALYPQYYKANYAGPRVRVTDISFRSMRPGDARAAALWDLMCNADVSDALALTAVAPGGGGFNLEPWYIEGLHYVLKPLNGQFADVTLSLDLSPQAYFADGTMFGVGT